MNIFEWLFERKNPQPVGRLSKENQPNFAEDYPIIWQIIIALIGLSILGWIIWALFIESAIVDTWFFAIIFIVYLLLARFVNAQPNLRNIGLFGGFMNHPLRYTDNLNRMLFFLQAILMPGKIIIASIYILLKYLKR